MAKELFAYARVSTQEIKTKEAIAMLEVGRNTFYRFIKEEREIA